MRRFPSLIVLLGTLTASITVASAAEATHWADMAQPALLHVTSGSAIGNSKATAIADPALIAKIRIAIGHQLAEDQRADWNRLPTLKLKFLDTDGKRMALLVFFEDSFSQVRLDAPGHEPVALRIHDEAQLRALLEQADALLTPGKEDEGASD